MNEFWSAGDIPEFLRSKTGALVEISEGELSMLYSLSKLSVGSRLTALGLSKEDIEDYWKQELSDRVDWCMKILKRKLTWAATGDPVLYRNPEIWQDAIGMSCSFRAFCRRVKRGNMNEHDVDLLERFLNGFEILIPD